MTMLAWLVHAYTASGAVLALLSLSAITLGRFRTAFVLLFWAVIVDSTDGWLARAADVSRRTPGFDGRRLDDLIDYLTYVFVPGFLIHAAGLLPSAVSLWIVAFVLLSSAYGFSHVEAKTPDHLFTGFPSYWNIAAFYLYAAGLPRPANAAILAALATLVFLPIRYVYPSRTPTLLWFTNAFCVVWGAVVLWMIWRLPDVSGRLLAGSLAFPVYYAALSFALTARRQGT